MRRSQPIRKLTQASNYRHCCRMPVISYVLNADSGRYADAIDALIINYTAEAYLAADRVEEMWRRRRRRMQV